MCSLIYFPIQNREKMCFRTSSDVRLPVTSSSAARASWRSVSTNSSGTGPSGFSNAADARRSDSQARSSSAACRTLVTAADIARCRADPLERRTESAPSAHRYRHRLPPRSAPFARPVQRPSTRQANRLCSPRPGAAPTPFPRVDRNQGAPAAATDRAPSTRDPKPSRRGAHAQRPPTSTSSSVSRIPAVSISSSRRPSTSAVSVTRSRVVPGIAVTMARALPASALNRLDFPTLGFPTMATRAPSRINLPRLASPTRRASFSSTARTAAPAAPASTK